VLDDHHHHELRVTDGAIADEESVMALLPR
jgi:hypothetical protein